MAHEYHTTRRIEFADTDMAGIIHFANYFRYMEEAEHDFLRSVGLSVMMETDAGKMTWPRVAASCEFVRPVRFEDLMDIHLSVARRGEKSLTYAAVFSREGQEVARGQLTVACCRLVDGELEAIPIPEFVRSKIEERPKP
jgi:acyl-CoA thioester hydrolase